MPEVILVRGCDTDGSVLPAGRAALQDKNVHSIDTITLPPPVLLLGEMEIHPTYHRVLMGGKEVLLNHGEYVMLYCMAKAPGRVYTREQLYTAAWENEVYPYGSNTVENTIFRLRQKLEPDPKHPVYIKTVFRAGYKVEDPSGE